MTQDMGTSSPSAPTALSSLRDGAAARLHPDGLQSHGAVALRESLDILIERSAAFDRMLDATLARDDTAYRQAHRDFWGTK